MDSNIKTFVLFNLAVLTLLILYMRSRSRSKSSFSTTKGTNKKVSTRRQQVEVELDPPPKRTGAAFNSGEEEEDDEISLNIIFTWNGHEWDAYEVLGIPAGSSMDKVAIAYDESLAKVDKQSQEFINKAYQIICNSRS